jgi:hypothetical protein
VNTKQLAAALRERADRNDDERLYDQNASELMRVLARVVEGKPIDRAFGAPGDWGYSTAIGQALAAKPATVPAGNSPQEIIISVHHVEIDYALFVEIDDEEVVHERTQRRYAVPGDALTSARHLVNEVTKGSK